jgi:hypothetical protein
MNNINSSLNFNRYLNPVYSPIQLSSFFTENCTGPIEYYSATIGFNLTQIPQDVFTNNGVINFILNNVKFEIATPPNQNQIPDPSLLTDKQQFIFFVKEVINNNPIFDDYQLTTIYTSSTGTTFITLTNRNKFTNKTIDFTSSTTSITFTEQLINFCYSAQTLDNYSLWVDVYTNNNKNLFNWSSITGITDNNFPKRLQATLYKTYQVSNSYIFNLESILQSVSQSTLPLINYGVTIFQQDLNSLNNLRLEFFESYDVTLGGIVSVRKFPLTVNSNTAIEDKWFWDAARNLTLNETKPYYFLDYQNITLSGYEINGKTQLLFNYPIEINERISISDSTQTVVFTASTSQGDKRYKIEQYLSATVENFITAFFDYFTNHTVTAITKGYSQVYLNLDNSFFNSGLDLTTTGSNLGNIIRTEFISSRTENLISLEFDPEDGINSFTEIKFLTDRPRQNTSLYYNPSQYIDNPTGLTTFHNSLSIFLNPYEYDISSSTTNLPVLLQGFFVRTKYYEDNEWSDYWTDSVYEPWLWNQGTLEGTDNGLYHIDLNPKKYSATTNTEKIKYCIGWFMKTSDNTYYTYNYSEEFEYDLVQVCENELVKTFLFLNDLGGWDYYDFIEDLTTEYGRTQTIIQTDLSGLSDKSTTYEQVFQNSIEQSFKIKTIVKSQDEYDWLYQLIKSSRVYYIETNDTTSFSGDYYQQVIITNSDYQQIENTNQWVLNIEYRIAQRDISQKSI